MRTESEIVAAAFTDAILWYERSPLHEAKSVVFVLQDLRTRIEQEIEGEKRLSEQMEEAKS